MSITRSAVARAALLAAVAIALPAAAARAQAQPLRSMSTTYTGCFAGIGCLTQTYTTLHYGPYGNGTLVDVVEGFTLQANFTSPHTASMVAFRNGTSAGPCSNGDGLWPGEIPTDMFGCANSFHVGAVNLQNFWNWMEYVPIDSPTSQHRWLGATQQVYVFTPIPGVEYPNDPWIDLRVDAAVQVVTLRTTAVPEPATAGLVALGALAIGAARRRRHRS